jgi:hypothetical protein
MPALALVLALAFSGCSNPTGGGGNQPPATYTISGTISTSNGGDAEGAEIQLKNSGGSDVVSPVTAGPNGVYSFSGVPAGTGYSIKVLLAGYAPTMSVAFDVSGSENKDVTLTAPGTTYTVSGTITKDDEEGDLEDVNVQLKNGSIVYGSATADASGEYTISSVPPGTGYTIVVSLTGYTTGTSDPFDVSDANVTGKDLPLVFYTGTTYTITGTITKSDGGGGAEGASVQLKDGNGPVGTAVTTNASGAYTISSVPAGTYTIEVTLEGYTTGTISGVTVNSSNVTGKDLTLARLYTISGTISTDDSGSAEGAKVQLKGSGGSNVGSAVTADSDGAYTISNVPAGTYTIEVTHTGYTTGTIVGVTVNTSNVTGKNLTLVKQKTLKITGITGMTGTVFVVLTDTEELEDPSALTVGGTAVIANGTATIILKTITIDTTNQSLTWTGDWTESGSYYVGLWNTDTTPNSNPSYIGYNDGSGKISFSAKETTVPFSQFVQMYEIQFGYWHSNATYAGVSAQFKSVGFELNVIDGTDGKIGYKTNATGAFAAADSPPHQFNDQGHRTGSLNRLLSNEDNEGDDWHPVFVEAVNNVIKSNIGSAPLVVVSEYNGTNGPAVQVWYIEKK